MNIEREGAPIRRIAQKPDSAAEHPLAGDRIVPCAITPSFIPIIPTARPTMTPQTPIIHRFMTPSFSNRIIA